MLFITVGTSNVSNLSASRCTTFVTIQELGKLFDDGGVVADGTTIVANVLQQGGTVKGRHHVVGIDGEDEIKIFDGEIVFTHVGAEQSSVVVSDEVVRFEVDGLVIVIHRVSVFIQMVVAECTIDEVARLLGIQAEGFCIILDGVLILFVAHQNACFHVQGIDIVLVGLQRLVDKGLCREGVFFLQLDLCLDVVAIGKT